MYRFLLTPKWVGFGLLMIAMSVVMIGLSDWQWHRYETRHGINVRIAQAKAAAPVPLESVASPDRPLPSDQEWVRVTVSGTYAPARTIIARERTVNDEVGFEIVTPLVLRDGSAVLIDRGFVVAGSAGSDTMPRVPAVPGGTVTIVGRVHLPDSKPDRPTQIAGQESVRRIAPSSAAPYLGYAHLYPDYILADSQTPAGAGDLTKIPADSQPAWMNAGYTIQWAGFALIPIVGFAYQARKDARGRLAAIARDRATVSGVPDLEAIGDVTVGDVTVGDATARDPTAGDATVGDDSVTAGSRAASSTSTSGSTRPAAQGGTPATRPLGRRRSHDRLASGTRDRVALADQAAAERAAAQRAAAGRAGKA